jgi:hypothetical protein
VSYRGLGVSILIWAGVNQIATQAQIDPDTRRLIQFGYNQPLEGRGPVAAYAFYYYNQPHFFATNLTLRLAIAPIYLDSELGFNQLLGPWTDLGIGLAGGGFADSYSEMRQGAYRKSESFLGHGGELSTSLYHRFNPAQTIPLWGVFRSTLHYSVYDADSDTADNFVLPEDYLSIKFRTGLRLGGEEPSLTEPLALELSIWHETQIRTESGPYGFAGDRRIESNSHLFWARGLLKYTFQTEHLLEFTATAGSSIQADRFSAFRLGGLLPFVTEFPLNIPGYYFQELTAKRFALLNAEYSFPIEPAKNWRFSTFAATAAVDYEEAMEQPGTWHSGVGGGVTYISPSGSWFLTLLYGHGFDAIRSHGRGANQVGLVFQYDFEAKPRGKYRWFMPGVDPYRSRGGERIFR